MSAFPRHQPECRSNGGCHRASPRGLFPLGGKWLHCGSVFSVALAAFVPWYSLAQQSPGFPPGKMYWSDRGTDQILRADFDGSHREVVVDGNDVPGTNQFRGLALDSATGTLFFCDNSADKIFRLALEGGGAVEEIVSGLGFPADIVYDPEGDKILWCDRDRDRIQRANPDGSAVEDVVLTESPYFLALDPGAGHLYWGDFSAGNIFRANLADGTGVETVVSGISGQTRGVRLDPVRRRLYWVSRNEGRIQSRDVDGGQVEDVYTGLDTPHGMAMDPVARRIYWADTGTNTGAGKGEDLVSRGDMDGSGAQEFLSAGAAANEPWDVELDLRPAPFAQWQARFFRIDRGDESGKGADPDRDGLPNSLECGLARHPLRPDYGDAAPHPLTVAGQVGIAFVRPLDPVPGTAVIVEQSANLLDWTDAGVTLIARERLANSASEAVVFGAGSGAFLRLRATAD